MCLALLLWHQEICVHEYVSDTPIKLVQSRLSGEAARVIPPLRNVIARSSPSHIIPSKASSR